MEFNILPVLSPEEVERFVTDLSRATFVDGKATAVGAAREAKHNLQAERSAANSSALDETIFAALQRNKEFQSFAFPKRILPPSYARYEPGMQYGTHIDGAVMGGVRTDLAMTLFLSSPETYDGGELVIEFASGEQEIKLAAGEAVVYPATTLHRVAPVTRGTRIVAVTWIQCAVREERVRSVLHDLSRAVSHAEAAKDAPQTLLLSKCFHNLLRCVVEP